MKLAAIVVAALAALAVQYAVLIRPWYQTWGATAEEMAATLPGDALWPDPATVETRAITIRAAPAQVWPWVAQLGQDRGGFYSYRLLENLLGCDMPAGDRLLGLPDPRPGERMWFAPPHRHGGLAYATFVLVEPGSALVVMGHQGAPAASGAAPRPTGTWAVVVRPGAAGETRLLVRGRFGEGAAPPALGPALLSALVLDPVHFVMERRMLLGIRERAEGRLPTPAWVDVTHVALWLATGLLGLAAAAAMLLRRAASWRSLAAATAALFVLTLLFFARPPLAVAVVLVALVRWAVSRVWRRPNGGATAAAG